MVEFTHGRDRFGIDFSQSSSGALNSDLHPALLESVASLPENPGVYRFLDGDGTVLYVGKAKSLKKRVTSYFHGSTSPRTEAMLNKACELALIITPTETDALILEATLIRQMQPQYNVLLKDDKSHPWLRITLDHPFPRLTLYRGERREGDRYFGPYPTVGAVRTTLKWLQSIFPLRQCEPRQFSTRKRPCLQFQIKRCQAPCMDLVSQEIYGQWVREVIMFLEGRDRQLLENLNQAMWRAANDRLFEEAASLRDRIKSITYVLNQRRLNLADHSDLDILCATTSDGPTTIEIFFVRHGVHMGNQSHFPENTEDLDPVETMEAFIAQFYAARATDSAKSLVVDSLLPPKEILVNLPLSDVLWLEAALSRLRGGPVRIRLPIRGEKKRLIELAYTNAEAAKLRRMSGKRANRRLLAELAEQLALPRPPERIEAYDVSHFQDAHPVASMAVFGIDGLLKREYRRFSIKSLDSVDDTSRMAEVLARRFRGANGSPAHSQEVSEPDTGAVWPDLVLLDGGKGQLNAVMAVVDALNVTGVTFCAMAKGEDRNAGEETLFLPGRAESIILSKRSAVLFLLQNIRDEAHRFAIEYHRSKRDQAQFRSALDQIPGVGPKRKKELLRRFGSVRAIREAHVDDLTSITGISVTLAATIVQYLQDCQEIL